MTIVDLYKIHINPEPSGSEIHELFMRFDLDGVVLHPDENERQEIARHRLMKENLCKEWIIKNSKL